MAELLLEILSEEIPARMQTKAADDLGKLLSSALEKSGLSVKDTRTFSGPRRLVYVADIPLQSPDVSEERKGPRVGAPQQAVAGFLRGAGLDSIEQADIRSDKKGEHYVAMINTKGQAAAEIIAKAVPEVMGKFPWPKSMKSGTTSFRWVRPLQSLLCVLDGDIVPLEVNGFTTSNTTKGHRRMGAGPFTVKTFKAYQNTLETKGHVLIDADVRKAKILKDAQKICQENGVELVEDIGLLNEVAGLAEWPTVILGNMDPAFLELPSEVIKLSMRTHQKYFAVKDPKTGTLAPHFVVVANQVAPDGGTAIAQGNSRVLSARLDDAKFFEKEDEKRPLESRFDDLDGVMFHRKLGTVKEKSKRVMALSRDLAPKVGADADKVELAAKLAKCDLVTNMVVEFTSLQGHIGRLMYQREGGDKDVALAIEEHYKPQGPSDAVPKSPISATVALADKLDILVGFWAIDEKPTGSKDPFALRRAALGVVRIILDNGIRLNLWGWLKNTQEDGFPRTHEKAPDLLAFILERLKVHLRDEGYAHDQIDAVYALGGDDLVDITNRIKALSAFLATDDGVNLLSGYKRAANILRAEAKKGTLPSTAPNAGTQAEETALYNAILTATPMIEAALAREDYAGAMATLADLRTPIDAFFDEVTVNSDLDSERANRLALLLQVQSLAGQIADFDKVEGG